MFVAGETSGDLHAAKVVRELRALEPKTLFEFFGSAGPKMRAEGVEPIVQADELSIVGLAEITRSLPMFLRAYGRLKQLAESRKPDAVVLVDFPEFNLQLAKSMKKLGLRVIYYVSPQLWAWRKYRISTIRKYVDLMITILPFEKEWYARNGFSAVEYVGSPLAREVFADMSKTDFCKRYGLDTQQQIVALLPGSRYREITRILPGMLDAAEKVRSERPDIQFLVAAANGQNEKGIERILQTRNSFEGSLITGDTYNLLNASDAAAIASGTATLEAGIIGTPMLVVYKTSPMNYRIFEPMIDVPHYGLINLIAEDRVAKELIQHEFTPSATADELRRLLEPAVNKEMREELKKVADKLGHGGASKRAAEAIIRTIDAKP